MIVLCHHMIDLIFFYCLIYKIKRCHLKKASILKLFFFIVKVCCVLLNTEKLNNYVTPINL